MDPHLNEIRGVQSHVNLSNREERGISDKCLPCYGLRFKVNIEVIVTRCICKVAAVKVSISAQTRLLASQSLQGREHETLSWIRKRLSRDRPSPQALVIKPSRVSTCDPCFHELVDSVESETRQWLILQWPFLIRLE